MNAPAPLDPAAPWPERSASHLLVSSSQMAALEQALFASGLPVEALMEKAALAVVAALRGSWWPHLERHGALVLVGPGHNGGDGLVIARELHLAGIATAIWSPMAPHKPLTAAHLRHGEWLGLSLTPETPDPASPALWIDALLGIGQNRAPEPALQQLLKAREQQRPACLVAVDVPTGIHADSGHTLGHTSATAHTTYTLGLIKRGLVQDRALAAVGRLERIDLGLPAQLLQTLPAETPLGLSHAAGAAELARPWPRLDPAAGKYERGRLLVIAGSEAYRGAAHLALLGASASGLGSLRACLPRSVAQALWQVLPHAVLQRSLACGPGGGLRLGQLRATDFERLDAVLLGPGIGSLDGPQNEPQQGAPPRLHDGAQEDAQDGAEAEAWGLLQAFQGLLLLDADGLNRIDLAWLQGRQGATWITPHAGEFGRLFADLAGQTPLDAAPAAARRSGCVVLLKGARSVVAAPDGRCWQLLQACPEAARAGLGDVLAGYAAGRGALGLAASQTAAQVASQTAVQTVAAANPAWLAAAALQHAQAAFMNPGDRSPAAIAQTLNAYG